MKTMIGKMSVAVLSVLAITSCDGGGDGGAQPAPLTKADAYQLWEVPPLGGEHIDISDKVLTGNVNSRSIYSNALVFETNPDGSFNGKFGGAIYTSSSNSDWSFGTIQAVVTSPTSLSATFTFSGAPSVTKSFVVNGSTKSQYSAETYSISGVWSDRGQQLIFDGAGNWTATDTTFGCSVSGTYKVSAPNSPVYSVESDVSGSGCYFIGAYESVPYEGTAVVLNIDGQPHIHIMQVEAFTPFTVGTTNSPYWFPYIGR